MIKYQNKNDQINVIKHLYVIPLHNKIFIFKKKLIICNHTNKYRLIRNLSVGNYQQLFQALWYY